ncbi:MAG: YifB family Mg chelatase-like AAA ATPase [Pseudomonadota bacterium]
MSYALVRSRASRGLEAPAVRVEVHLSSGLPAFNIVGMLETAVRESRDRVRSALINSHFEFPDGRLTVNLAPADLPKGGGRFDLAIALGILCASDQLPAECIQQVECIGELGLDGGLCDVRGCIAAAIAATRAGHRIALPVDAARRCHIVPQIRSLGAPDLLSLCAVLRGHGDAAHGPAPAEESESDPVAFVVTDLAEVQGQPLAKRALELAAAGGHNLLFCGPPGTGKSMLASCLPGILPAPDPEETLTMHALTDLRGARLQGVQRPFRAPHHSASAASLIGGGSIPQPGEISLAHGGVLFLDELAEFPRSSLDMLREPLESGEIHLARAQCSVRYPARFQLIAAMNPCPCGYAGDARRRCRCSAAQRLNYSARLSGPLLDRIDLQVRVTRDEESSLFDESAEEGSAQVGERVRQAVATQRERQGCSNARLAGGLLLEHCGLRRNEKKLLDDASRQLQLSRRAIHRVLRVARTIADIERRNDVRELDLQEALAYRQIVAERAY